LSREEEIRDILLKILRTGILSARAAGWSNRADRCAIEADHVHNLPNLIRDLQLDLLIYYFEIERPDYIKQGGDRKQFESEWQRLGEIIDEMRVPK
jgi:hypothetical protein